MNAEAKRQLTVDLLGNTDDVTEGHGLAVFGREVR